MMSHPTKSLDAVVFSEIGLKKENIVNFKQWIFLFFFFFGAVVNKINTS